MAINFSFTINSANLAKIYREKNAYTNCLSFFVDEESYIFRGLPLTIDGTSGIIEKSYEYNGIKLEISLTISNITSSRLTYNATASVDYTINGEEYTYPNGATLDWSIENSIILRDNNGYMPADTTGANPENEYYFLTSDTSVVQGKTYYQLVTTGEDSYSYNVVNNPSGNPKNLGYYEAAPKKYYTQETSGINIDSESQDASFIRLDKYGLYGVTKGTLTSGAVPRGISQIQDEAMFSLTWDGYTLKTTHPDGNGLVKIGATEDIVIKKINTNDEDTPIEETVGILGYLDDSLPKQVLYMSGDGNTTRYEAIIYSYIENFLEEDNPHENGWYELTDGEYKLTEDSTLSVSAVIGPTGNPSTQHWYEKNTDDAYFLTSDITVTSGKTYYNLTKKYFIITRDFSRAFLDIYITEVYIDNVLQVEKTNDNPNDYYFEEEDSDDTLYLVFTNAPAANSVITLKIYNRGSYNSREKYGVYSNNLYIGDLDNFLSFYQDSNQSAFIIKTDNFYFDTDIKGDKNVRDLVSTTLETVDSMTYLYRDLDSWISVQSEGHSSSLIIADHNTLEKTELHLTSEEMSFIKDGNVMATIDNEKMTIDNANIAYKLQFGNYGFITRSNGHLSLKYLGE